MPFNNIYFSFHKVIIEYNLIKKNILVFILGFSLLVSLVPLPVLAEPLSNNQIATEFLAKEYGQIDIVKQQSYPIQDGPWITEFVTQGTHDLIISAIDGTSFWGFNSDVSFVELYDGNKKLVPVIKNNKIIFPNYSSDDTSHLKVIVNTIGQHHLKFEFGSDVAYANNFASADSSTKIASGTNGGPTLSDSDEFGFSVTNIGDLNNDGINDLAVGAFSDDTGGTDRGAVYILFMATSGSATSTVKIASDTNGGPTLVNSDFFGRSVTNLGDLNNDGTIDLAVGAHLDDTGGTSRGATYVLFMDETTIVTDVTSTATDGTFSTLGTIIDITATFSESVTVSGTPQLTLETGTIDRTADYSSGSGSATLTFKYALQDGDFSSDLDYVATTSLSSGTSITETASLNNNAVLTLPTPGDLGSLGFNKALVIAVSSTTGIAAITVTATLQDNSGGFTALASPQAVTTVVIGSNTYALVTSETEGIQIIDITTPTSPTVVGTSGFIVDGSNGFTILNNPSDIDTFTIGSSTYAIVAAEDDNGIQIIDISTPASPVASGVAVDGSNGFTNLAAAKGVDTFTIGSSTYAIVTGNGDTGIQIIDISTPATPSASGVLEDTGSINLDTPQGVTTVVIGSSTYALVTSEDDNGIQIIDISIPATPSAITNGAITDSGSTLLATPSGANGITTVVIGSSTYAIVAGSGDDGITIIDISTPTSPSVVSTIADNTGLFTELQGVQNVEVVTVGGSTYILAASTTDNGFEIINISNPLSPVHTFARSDGVGSFSELAGALHMVPVTISGTTYAIVIGNNDDGLHIVTLKEPVSGASAGSFVQLLNDKDGIGGTFSAFDLGVNSTDHIFVADRTGGSNAIQKYDSSGIFVSSLTTGISSPHDVVHDSNDRIIVANDGGGGNNVKIYSSTGSLVTTLTGGEAGATTFVFPHGVATDSSNNIYIVDRDAGTGILQKYNSAGAHQLTLTGGETGATDFNEPLGVAVDSNGRIIVTQRAGFDGFQIFDSGGNFVQKVTVAAPSGDTVFDDPHDVAVDSYDRIYIADEVNSRIQIFDSTGTFEQSITTGISALISPSGVAIDSTGRILVYDSGSVPQQIVIFQGLGAPTTETTTVAASVFSDSSESTQEIAEAEAAAPDETFALEEEEYAEVVSESLAVPILETVEVPVIETFEAVSAPEKVEAIVEDTSFKVLSKVLSKSNNKEDDAKKLGLEYKDGDVRALVILDETSDAVINEIKKYANIESVNADLVQINIPLDDLSTLYKIPDITKVQPTSKAIQNVLTSQGYDVIQAQIPHGLGVQADGIKIAVLDLAFDVTNDEIKNNIMDTKTFRHDFDGLKIPLTGFGHEATHGTAVSEIVIDVAPKADLYLYTFAAEVEFLDAMDYAMEQKVDLITMSAGWVNYPTDGTSEMTKKVEQAIDMGIPFVVSAGNYAETHWQGSYVDSNNNGWHEFAPSDEGISVVASEDRVEQGIPFVLYLMWDSPSKTIYDFDLSMTDEEGDVISYSANLQESSNAINFEFVYFTPESPGTYSLGILYGGDDESPDVILELFSPSDKLEYPVSAGSVSVPTDARGVISVGALNYYDSRLEPFSSQGPTNHCVQAPSIMGPDAVATLAYDKNPFFGTSAAAPHVAGMVALMLDKTPQLTPLQILSELISNTETEFASYEELNNVFGFGAADSKFIAELDEIVTPITLEDGCIIGELQKGNRVGESIVQVIEVTDVIKIPIPEWVKLNTESWSDGTMNDETFVNAIGFLIEKEIIDIPMKQNISEAPKDKEKHQFEEIDQTIPIPDWIKNNAAWWSDGTINDDAFVSAIQYLVEQGIIQIN